VKVPEDQRYTKALSRFEDLKSTVELALKSAQMLHDASASFAKEMEYFGRCLQSEYLWSKATANNVCLVKSTAHAKSVHAKTFSSPVVKQFIYPLKNKLKGFQTLEMGVKKHDKLKDQYEKTLYDIEHLTKKLEDLRRNELSRIVDAAKLEEVMKTRHGKHQIRLKKLKTDRTRLKKELAEDTEMMIAGLECVHDQIHTFMETSGVASLENAHADFFSEMQKLYKSKSIFSRNAASSRYRIKSGSSEATKSVRLSGIHTSTSDLRDPSPQAPPRISSKKKDESFAKNCDTEKVVVPARPTRHIAVANGASPPIRKIPIRPPRRGTPTEPRNEKEHEARKASFRQRSRSSGRDLFIRAASLTPKKNRR